MAKKKEQDSTRSLNLGVQGFSGLKQSGGMIDEEFLPRLKGQYGIKTYREMADNSSAIGAVLYVIKALVRQVEWRVEPASPEQEALDQAQFLEECMGDMSLTWEDLISEVLSFLPYGWSNFELVYKLRRGLDVKDASMKSQYNDGKIGWRKIALRAQDTLERWEFDEDGGLRGMHQLSETTGQTAFIPIEKSILFRTEVTKNNPEGRSILRNAVTDWFYLKRIAQIEAIGIERDMTGLLTMEVPIEILDTNAGSSARALRAQLEKMLAELKRDEREYAMVPTEMDREGKPTGYKLKLLTTGGSRQINTNETKLYYKVSILQSMVAQFLQLGMSGVGSFALASSQTDLFAVSLGSFLQIIASTFNRFAVSRLMTLNGVPVELWPEVVYGDIETPALAEIGQYIQALAGAGKLPEDEVLDRRLLEIAGLPIPEQEGHGEGQPPVLEPEAKRGVRKALRAGRTHRKGCGPMRLVSMPKVMK
jgi:hypothetical protein